MVRHILVGIDGSERSYKAARFAHDLAQQTQARITLLFVLEPPRVLPLGPVDAVLATSTDTRTAAELERVRRSLDELVADLPRAQVDPRVELGPVVETLLSQATSLGVDLIVVGARGTGLSERWRVGAVSDRIVHHATIPVTVVH